MLRPPGANFQLLFLRLAQAFGSRIRPDARLWFIFPFQPRTACSLLKWEQLTLCALGVLRGLGVLGGQNVFGSSAARDSRYNVSEGKIFRNLLEACSASAYASLHHDCPSLEPRAE